MIPLALLVLTIPNVYATHDGQHVCSDGKLPYWELGGWWCEGEPQNFSNSSVTVSLTTGNTHTSNVTESNHIDDNSFTGWKQEGNRMVAYRMGEVVNSYEIGALPTEQRPEPNIDTTAFDFTEDAGILSLRLQIMQVLESILSILFRV